MTGSTEWVARRSHGLARMVGALAVAVTVVPFAACSGEGAGDATSETASSDASTAIVSDSRAMPTVVEHGADEDLPPEDQPSEQGTDENSGADDTSGTDAKPSTDENGNPLLTPNDSSSEGQPSDGSLSGDAELDGIIENIIANEIGGRDGQGDEALRRAYEYMASNYSYREMNEWPPGDWTQWSVEYAKEMYQNKIGNCYRFSSLFCWIARGLGYDAKVIAGTVPQNGEMVAHGWIEIQRDGTLYICDPDLHKFRPEYNLFMVTYDQAPINYTKVQ